MTAFFPLSSFTVTFDIGIQINGAVYSSRPIPQFVQARLNESEAAPFNGSEYDGVPRSILDTHLPVSSSFISTSQNITSPYITCFRFQFNGPKVSSRIFISTRASLYKSRVIPFSYIAPTLTSISSAIKRRISLPLIIETPFPNLQNKLLSAKELSYRKSPVACFLCVFAVPFSKHFFKL